MVTTSTFFPEYGPLFLKRYLFQNTVMMTCIRLKMFEFPAVYIIINLSMIYYALSVILWKNRRYKLSKLAHLACRAHDRLGTISYVCALIWFAYQNFMDLHVKIVGQSLVCYILIVNESWGECMRKNVDCVRSCEITRIMRLRRAHSRC